MSPEPSRSQSPTLRTAFAPAEAHAGRDRPAQVEGAVVRDGHQVVAPPGDQVGGLAAGRVADPADRSAAGQPRERSDPAAESPVAVRGEDVALAARTPDDEVGLSVPGEVTEPADGVVPTPLSGQLDPAAEVARPGPAMKPEPSVGVARQQVDVAVAVQVAGRGQLVVAVPVTCGRSPDEAAGPVAEIGVEDVGGGVPGDQVVVAVLVEVAYRGEQVAPGEGSAGLDRAPEPGRRARPDRGVAVGRADDEVAEPVAGQVGRAHHCVGAGPDAGLGDRSLQAEQASGRDDEGLPVARPPHHQVGMGGAGEV